MNQRPRSTEPTSRGASGGRQRGQSDVLAIVLLLGMVFLGATAVVVTGGFLIDSVQGNSEHELARDSAVQTHQQIAEALQSGQARELAVGDGIDMEVQQTGSIAIEMRNGAGDPCSDDSDLDVDRVDPDLGAIVYDTPQGAIVYQGGAIWERTEGGLSIERNPPISYENDSARISVQTVSTEEDSFEGQMARPDEEMQETMAEETNRMLTQCPADGYTTLEIDVTSPNYADLWKQHFDEQVDGPGVDVRGPDSADTVSAVIENATSAHASRGLRFDEIDGPDPAVIGDTGTYANHFNVTTAIVNDDFVARNASVELELGGQTRTNNSLVGTTGTENLTLPGPPGPSWNALNSTYGLDKGEVHEYTLRLTNTDTGEVSSTTTGRFYLAEPGAGNVDFFDDSHHFEDGEDTLVVNASLINTMASPASGETVEFQITDDRVNMTNPASEDIDVPAFGETKGISYEINVSALAAGKYEYQLHHEDDETLTRNFTIDSPPPGSGSIVGDLRVEAIEPSTDYLEKGDPFSVRVQLYNTAADDTTTDVSIDLLDDDLSAPPENVTVGDGNRTNVTVELDGGDIADELETRTEHDYEVTIENEGDEESFNGTFVVLESNASLQIDAHNTEPDGDWRWINATLANHGNKTGSDNATLSVYDNETDEAVGTKKTDEPVSLEPANETTVPFSFDASELGGAYRYEVSYGEETVEGYFTEGDADTGDGNVSFTAPGNGTVSVLGTEISWYTDGFCHPLGCTPPPQKGWAPTTVSTILQTDGEETVETFDNTAADESSYENVTNLNTYDTQDAIYTKDWTQTSGESATLTVSSSYWSVEDDTRFNTRDDGTEDIQPGHDIMDDEPSETVNAHAETNKHAVKVLEDGDEIPNPRTSGEDQRSAAEVLNQGAADRIDDETLDLGPYEAVFLFELTTSSYDGMWNDSFDDAADPDFNDVIALVSFNPDEPDDVNFDVGDHSLSIRPAEPDDPENANESGEQDIGINTSQSPGDGGNPSAPTPQNPDPGDPSESDEIDVDVGGVVIG